MKIIMNPDRLRPLASKILLGSFGRRRAQTSITTGTLALLFKPHAVPSVKAAALYEIFVPVRAFRG
jgi:hypothetical protein